MAGLAPNLSVNISNKHSSANPSYKQAVCDCDEEKQAFNRHEPQAEPSPEHEEREDPAQEMNPDVFRHMRAVELNHNRVAQC